MTNTKTAIQALMARQNAQIGFGLIQLPEGVERASWLHTEAVPDRFWTHPDHHPSSGLVIGQSSDCRWIITQMTFNWRLIGVPVEYAESNPEYGWCFASPAALMLAANAWDPETQDEPLGWHKRAGIPRRAPRRDELKEYNQPRCVHGSYLHETCAVDPYHCREH